MDWIIGAAGLSLIAAPFVLHLGGLPAWLIAVGGIVTAVLGGYRAVTHDRDLWEEACIALAGLVAGVAALVEPSSSSERFVAAALAGFVAMLALVQARRARAKETTRVTRFELWKSGRSVHVPRVRRS